MQRAPGFTEADTILAVTTLSFDIAGLELYLPLITGGTVAIASRDDVVDPDRLMERIRESGCTVLQATPSAWRALVNAGWSGSPDLKILCGGEALPSDLAESLLQRCGELWNMYGPTETTIWSTIHRVASAARQAPIGRPIANTQVFVLNAQRDLVPVGVPGELYIGGHGLARGYLHREELTRERFVPSPFAPGARLYRTGDLARWLADGSLEWLGRIDQQVKVRGFRIEPGEIETAIARHPAVRDAVVIAREDVSRDSVLVAYFVATDPPDDIDNELRALIRTDLPEYMMPARFIRLDSLPQTANGKVDRKALPMPAAGDAAVPTTATPPRTSTEEAVMQVFCDVVGRSDFGVFDSFFELGGHSLMAARLMTKLRAACRVDLPLRTLFERPTVAALAEAIDALSWAQRAGYAGRIGRRARGDRPVTVSALLDDLRRRNVRVWAEGDQLRCNAPAGVLTAELRGQLQARKTEILGFLNSAKVLADQPRAVVPLQPLGTRPPVFAVAGHNGDVFCYRAMAQRLGADQPFFGLQPPGADGQSQALTSVEDIAAYFASQIRAFRPNGPYLLAGYCAGGTIAFELARQLTEAGARVPLVALFASPHPGWYRRVPQLRHRVARQIDRVATHTRALASLTPSQRRSYVGDKLRARRTQRQAEHTESPDPLLALRARVEAATLRAVRRYTPRHFAGRVTLFLPSRDWLRYRSALLRWRSMADEIDVRCGPDGCPDTGMLLEPDVAVSAELFQRCCDDNDADGDRELDYTDAAGASARSA